MVHFLPDAIAMSELCSSRKAVFLEVALEAIAACGGSLTHFNPRSTLLIGRAALEPEDHSANRPAQSGRNARLSLPRPRHTPFPRDPEQSRPRLFLVKEDGYDFFFSVALVRHIACCSIVSFCERRPQLHLRFTTATLITSSAACIGSSTRSSPTTKVTPY